MRNGLIRKACWRKRGKLEREGNTVREGKGEREEE